MKKTNRWIRVIAIMAGCMALFGGLFVFVSIIPSKITVEDFKYYPTYFTNLSEKRLFSGSFIATYDNLERVDVLFKNPNLESRDELKIRILNENGVEVVQKDFSGFNLGDTSHARVDLPKGRVSSGDKVEVEVYMTKLVDGKLMFGTKNGSINFIQYYDSNTKKAVGTRFVNILKKVSSQPIVVLLPLVVGIAAIW